MSNTHCEKCHSQVSEAGEHYYNTTCVRDRIKELEGAIQDHQVTIHDKLQRVASDYCPEDKKLWAVLTNKLELGGGE